jgi:murein DD-endopeptidase MepM/ murein hydrolase activator NlpD
MIESHTKLPMQERGAASIWTKGYQLLTSLGSQAAAKVQSLSLAAAKTALSQGWSPAISSPSARWLGLDLVNRYALHLVVILLAIGVVTVSQIKLPAINFIVTAPTASLDSETETSTVPLSSRGAYRPVRNSAISFQMPVPHTNISEIDRSGIITYTVQPNDTIWGIAQAHEIAVETIMWANAAVEQDPDLLNVGQILTVLPVNGVYYTVKAGDTLDKLAKTYKTTVDKIAGLELNGLSQPYTLAVGQQLILVDGQKPLPKPRQIYYPLQVVGTPPKGALVGSGRFMWPVVGYWMRGFTYYHLGVDIANSIGKPVYAADDGYVMLAGTDTWGYGQQIVLNHGNGFKTRYAHLSKILVKAGQSVKRGEKIGLVGSTGRSTGPHLHFEIIKNGVAIDPTLYLPR